MTEVQERVRVIGNDILWTRILHRSTMILTFDLETEFKVTVQPSFIIWRHVLGKVTF